MSLKRNKRAGEGIVWFEVPIKVIRYRWHGKFFHIFYFLGDEKKAHIPPFVYWSSGWLGRSDGFECGDDVRITSNLQSKCELPFAMFDPLIKGMGVISLKSTQRERERRGLQLELLIYTTISIKLTLGGSNEIYSIIERTSNLLW
jgi:hypothetical protein